MGLKLVNIKNILEFESQITGRRHLAPEIFPSILVEIVDRTAQVIHNFQIFGKKSESGN